MRNWVIGGVLVVLALGLLYGAAVAANSAPNMSWVFIALFAAVAATGVLLGGRVASRAGPPPEYVERARLGPRFELPDASPGPDAWAGTARTLGVMAIALVGLLLHLVGFVTALYLETAWLVYPALLLTVVLLVVIIIFASPRGV